MGKLIEAKCPACGGVPYRTSSGLFRCDGLNLWNGGINQMHDEVLFDDLMRPLSKGLNQ